MNCSGFLSLAGWLCLAVASRGAADEAVSPSPSGRIRASWRSPEGQGRNTGVPPVYPLWDGHETIAQYARRVSLPETKTLDLGNGVSLELVLIPAGKFIMGTPEPESPLIGFTISAIAGLIVLGLVVRLAWHADRQHRPFQFSLCWLIFVVLILGVAQYGGFRYWRALHGPHNFSAVEMECPAHVVTLARPFYMGKFGVTQEQFQQVMGTNPSFFKGANLPVQKVSWDDAQEFCKRVNEKARQTVRLPTEAEREYACRAGTATWYCTGNTTSDAVQEGWFGENSQNTVHPVGQKTPNAWGVYDMHGNLYEWCQDWFEPYEAGEVVDPQGPAQGECRVLRGGSYCDSAWFSHSTRRKGLDPEIRGGATGFRVVMETAPRTP